MTEPRCSRRKVIIELDAPSIVSLPYSGVVEERIVSEGHECSYCRGHGRVLRLDAAGEEWEWQECPVCGGTGELDAEVTIRWKARGEL